MAKSRDDTKRAAAAYSRLHKKAVQLNVYRRELRRVAELVAGTLLDDLTVEELCMYLDLYGAKYGASKPSP